MEHGLAGEPVPPSQDHASDVVRRARWATATIFLINGAVLGTWAAHIPLVEARLGISHATLGIALLFMAAGALIAMPLTGGGIARFGSAAIIRAATIVLLVALPFPLIAPHPALLMAALFLLGAANGVLDVSMNAHGVMVERRLGRAVMSSLHGMWSLGGLAGAGLAAILLPVVAPLMQVFAMLALAATAALVALAFLLPSSDDGQAGGVTFALPSRATLGLGILCFLCMSSEGAVLDWGALHLASSFQHGAGFAATGFAVFSAAMAAARFAGDRMRGVFGAVALVRGSGFLAAAGMVVVLTVPAPAIAVAGFALVGLGLANLVPVFFGVAGRITSQQAGGAIAAVATLGYTGFLLGPPVIGFVADAAGLSRALGLIVLACVAIALSAGVVRGPGNQG